jgi:hypothetical protein
MERVLIGIGQLRVAHLFKKLPDLHEPESLPYSQQSALVPILSQMNQVYTFTRHSYKTNIIIIIPIYSSATQMVPSFRFFD